MKKTGMKYLIPALALLALVSCKTNEILTYQYRSTTMLGTRTLTVTQDSVVTRYNGRTESTYSARVTTPEEWAELKEGAEKLKLKDLADLASPSNRRQTDAAPYGTVFLTTKDSTYQSSSFDGYNAHKDLEPLMMTIKKMAQVKR